LKDVTVEDLKIRFVVAKVAPYGEVIMVPGADFDPDWEAMLEEEGFGCVFTEINGEKFTLVKLEKEEEGGEETAAGPEVRRRRGILPGEKINLWSDADEERLLKRIEELPGTIEEKVAQLMSEFPGRTAMALQKKYEKLMHGKKRRPIGRPRKAANDKCPKCGLALDLCMCAEIEEMRRTREAEEEQVGKRVESEEYVSAESAKSQLDVVKTLAKIEDNVEALLEFTKVHAVYIAKIHCMAVMQALETQEHKCILLISPKLRDHYVEALGSTDGKAAAVFLEKARLLVEASS